MTTIRRSDDQTSTGLAECDTRLDNRDTRPNEPEIEAPDLERAEPAWPGFRAARLITLMKMRGDARAAALLALLIIAATVAVLGAPHFGGVAQELGAFLGIGLRASEVGR